MTYIPAIDQFAVLPIGSIILWPSVTMPIAPPHTTFKFVVCDGTLYNNSDYPDASSIITAYGQTLTQFRVPDLRGRFPLGVGTNPNVTGVGSGAVGTGTAGTPRNFGDFGGEEAHVQTEDELAPHIHTNVITSTGGSEHFLDGGGGTAVTGETNTSPPYGQTDSAGTGNAMPIVPSFIALNFIIRLL